MPSPPVELDAKMGQFREEKARDLGKKFLADDGTLPAEVMPDGLHLSEKGYGIGHLGGFH